MDDQSLQTSPGPVTSRSGRRLVTLLRAATVLAVLALLALLIWDVAAPKSGAKFTALINQKKRPSAPTFVLPVLWAPHGTLPLALRVRLEDGRVDISELRGYRVVLNFWASWCRPCRDEAPAFHAVAQRYAGRVVFLGVDNQDLKSSARTFLRNNRVNYVSVRDGSDRTYNNYGLTGLPETYFLDIAGRAVGHAIGALSRDELQRQVQSLLNR
jgi:thiol-disulfide isomerase/thioredoxin